MTSEIIKSALRDWDLVPTGYNPRRKKKYEFKALGLANIEMLSQYALKEKEINSVDLLKALKDLQALEKTLEEVCSDIGLKSPPPKPNEEWEKLVSGLVLCRDVSLSDEKDPAYFLATESGKLSDLPANVYLTYHKPEDPANIAVPAVREYMPREALDMKKKTTIRGTDVFHINGYLPPKWQDFAGSLPDELPGFFSRLIEHLFPEKSERKFFFHWLYISLTKRADTFLVLQGDPGIGKNRLKEHIRALHGESNSVDGKLSTLTTQFNGQLSDTTLVWFDEIQYGPKEENIMKEIPNGTISIEKKHRDSTQSTKIHCSLVLSNNRPRDNYISFDGRKFSPVAMTSKRLDEVMTIEEIYEMGDKVFDERSEKFDIAYVAQIGRWVLKHGRDKTRKSCEYRGPKFWELCHSTMPAWQKFLIEKIFSSVKTTTKLGKLLRGKEFTYYSLLEALPQDRKRGRQPSLPDPGTARYFFEVFRDLQGEKIFGVSSLNSTEVSASDFNLKVLKEFSLFVDENTPGEDLL